VVERLWEEVERREVAVLEGLVKENERVRSEN
jgi:hypothetical protein